MNITELARRLKAPPEELRKKLPELGFSFGARAIKIDTRQAQKIIEAWSEMKRKERLAEKVEMQKSSAERRRDMPLDQMKKVKIPAVITVREFASLLDLPVPRVMQELMRNGILTSINQQIDFDTASIIGGDLGFLAEKIEGGAAEDMDGLDRIRESVSSETAENLVVRAPVIVVMGHVDHGKTRLLDAIRSTNVMETESGGITQHIGAYQVVRGEQKLTFIDTPGHEAFTVMRSRGAKVADIAILVVAADDGIQPQTKEAIDIIKSAKLPFLVALNKIDREQANIDRVKGELSELGLVPEDWGGTTIVVPISAKEGTGIETLLDMLILVRDMEKERIVANPARKAIGTIIESNVNSGSGPVATVLVQSGTLRVGDDLGVRGTQYGRVRRMENWKGEQMMEAPPSTPVKILGWKVAPSVGDIMEVPQNIKDLKKMKSTDSSNRATDEVASIKHVQPSPDSGDADMSAPKAMLNLIIRSDVLGSLEAILGMLDKVHHEQVGVKVIQKGLGNITDADIMSAEAGKAIVIGFNVKPTSTAMQLSRDKEVEIREYKIIYKLFEAVLEDLKAMAPAEIVITELGTFEVLKNFKKLDNGWIIGGRVRNGKLIPKALLRLSRAGEYIGEGSILSLQLGRSELKDAREGQEIGMSFKGKVKPEEGDIIEAYSEQKIQKEFKIEGINLR